MAFWSFTPEKLKELAVEASPFPKVRCDGREWRFKQDDRSLNEVVGYQIASAIDLPLQPWLAFESPAPRNIGAGLFIEWWTPPGRLCSSLVGLGEVHSALIARGLAFDILRRPEGEWPEWMLSDDMREVRLIDLDGTGPLLTVPPCDALLEMYLSDTKSIFHTAKANAEPLGITDAFYAEVDRLLAVDFSSVVDLSGHPCSFTLTEMMTSGLRIRQREVAKLMSAV